ncbi:hypothetical protein EDF60_1623 [Leucobacter luti]|uniref:hypothetical protein n=1 Tax=Leucobacter luti TaxID=340320 RepID=UPI00104AB588|nr:hypothetical protein [Leucobacter luti]MCW2286975.1 hypothetical protein [Leucobacter luti]TCK41201.1 hypothetical protein EDF60_1623 [Leucobacter luti]
MTELLIGRPTERPSGRPDSFALAAAPDFAGPGPFRPLNLTLMAQDAGGQHTVELSEVLDQADLRHAVTTLEAVGFFGGSLGRWAAGSRRFASSSQVPTPRVYHSSHGLSLDVTLR